MESNKTVDDCDRDNDCLFEVGDGLFRVWHVILIAAVIALAISECTHLTRPFSLCVSHRSCGIVSSDKMSTTTRRIAKEKRARRKTSPRRWH